jgi:hypothetical protein
MQLPIVQTTRRPTDAGLICGYETVRQRIAVTRQPIRSDKVSRFYCNSFGVTPLLYS